MQGRVDSRPIGLVFCSLISALSFSCQTSYLIAKGDRAFARGEPDRAISDYLAALERKTIDPAELEEKIDRAARVLAEREVDEARALASADQLEPARIRLWQVLLLDAWGSDSARAQILDALEALDRTSWQSIEALADQGRYLPALHRANALVTPYPEGHPARKRLADLARKGQEHHFARAAESGDPAVAWFHDRMAIACGAEPPKNFQELERTIAANTAYAWRVEIDDRACPSLSRAIAERLQSSEQSGPIVNLHFDHCRETDAAWSEREKMRYHDRVPRPRFVEEQVWIEKRDPDCEVEACLKYDELGVCLERPPAPAKCSEPPERELSVRQVPVIEYERVYKEIDVEVKRRKIEVEAKGRIRFEGEEDAPFDVVETLRDREFWSPDQNKIFTGVDRTKVAETAFDKVKAALDRRVGEVRAERAIRASAQQKGEQAESLHVLAVRVAQSVPEAAARHFESSYGMSKDDVVRVIHPGPAIFAQSPLPPRRELPPAELDRDLNRFEHTAVARGPRIEGLAQLAEVGVDIGFTGASSALSSADLVFGLEACARVSRLVLTGSAQSTVLAGDVGGFALSMAGLAFDLDKVGFFFGWGLAYAQQRTEAGERYRIFTIPISIHVPLWSWLWLSASIEPNLLYAKTIFDDDEGDPHFWSPVRAWATFDLLQRVFLRAGVAHYLGAGFREKPVQAELVLGVRL